MPTISRCDAVEKLASGVQKAKPTHIPEILAELFPANSQMASHTADEIAQCIRRELAVEEIVDLWNVVFPEDRNVWYDDETNVVHFNEALAGYLD